MTSAPNPRLAESAVIIPTLDAGAHFPRLVASLSAQGISPTQVLVIDSCSDDGSHAAATAAGYQLITIPRAEFNNGATRQLAAVHFPNAQFLIYLTQDAEPLPGAFSQLLAAFDDPTVAAAYGRQLPRPGATPLEAYARLFNYPPQSRINSRDDLQRIGVRACFFSNTFAAYRASALLQIGGFPTVIMAEDALAAARLLLAGWRTAYVSAAECIHSHPYTLAQEFRRYFDTGVYHSLNPWLLAACGQPSGEGRRFVLSELAWLLRHAPLSIPYALARTTAKLAGYRLGRLESHLSLKWCERLSLHKGYWRSPYTHRLK
jgi:rhamnosyltransferase